MVAAVSQPEPPLDDDPASSDPAPADPAPQDPGAADLEVTPRRYPSTIGGAFYLVVLAVTAVGIGIVWSGDWRVGVRWMGGALLFGALVRLVLPARDAGMLAVRHRLFDCILLAAVGVVLVVLAGTIPNQPV
jgi:hypothetical protein